MEAIALNNFIPILEEILQSETTGPCLKAIKLICAEESLSSDSVAKCLNSLQKIHPAFDQKIASFIERFGQTLSSDATIKLLAILDHISDCSRIRFMLLRLRNSPDPRVQSKVALLLGRGVLNLNLIEDQLTAKDPRVRANAVESTWRVKDVAPLLRAASFDPNNRVVGNALLALYKLGEPDVAAAITAMVQHESEAFQITALWVMGETEDAQFGDTLRSFAQKASGKVRWMALRSLGRLKRASDSGKLRAPEPASPDSQERGVGGA